MPDVYPSYSPAQMGNLNKDSTHPNPWYPPTELERFRGGVGPYRIWHNPYDPIGPIKKAKIFLEQDPFMDNCRFGAVLGAKVGILVAANDIINVNQIDANRARFARVCFIVPPYMAMGVSFVCAREVLGNVSKEKNALWTYPAAAIAPGTVWGLFKNDFLIGLRMTAMMALFATYWKYNHDMGHVYDVPWSFLNAVHVKNQDYNHETGLHREQSIEAEGWKGWPFTANSVKNWWTQTDEPSWKKHVSPEEAKRGPPTNF